MNINSSLSRNKIFNYFLYSAILFTAFVFLNCHASEITNNEPYFDALEKINALQTNQQAIPPCSENEKKELIVLLKNSKDEDLNSYAIDHGAIVNQYGETLEIYKGDFSNEQLTQYALISTGGTMRSNTVTILEKQNDLVVKRNLDTVIIENLIPDSDMSEFYMHVAKPFAFKQDGKTYIRYMNIPYKKYDIAQLQLCTYLWEADVIQLTGPNWTFDKKSGKMVPYNDCISR